MYHLRRSCIVSLTILQPYFNHTSTIFQPFIMVEIWIIDSQIISHGAAQVACRYDASPMRVWFCRHLITFLRFLPMKRVLLVPCHGLLGLFCLVLVSEGKLLGALQGRPCCWCQNIWATSPLILYGGNDVFATIGAAAIDEKQRYWLSSANQRCYYGLWW